jgi:hypothetical protein
VSEELYSIGRVLLTHVGVKRAVENWCLLVRNRHIVRLKCYGDLIDVRDSELRRHNKHEVMQIKLAEDASPHYLLTVLRNYVASANGSGFEQVSVQETRGGATWPQVEEFIHQRMPSGRAEQCQIKLGAAASGILINMPDIQALKPAPVPPPPVIEPDRGPLWGSW